MWTLSGSVYGALVGLGLYVYLVIPDQGVAGLSVSFLHLVFFIPWILLSQLFAQMVFVGLASYESESEADREWLGRASGWFLSVGLIWLALLFLVLYFGVVVAIFVTIGNGQSIESLSPMIAGISGIIAGISGIITALFGASRLLAVKGGSIGVRSYLMRLVLPPTALVFVAALLIAVSYTLDGLFFGSSMVDPSTPGFPWGGRFSVLLVAFVVTVAVAIVASKYININRFSLHAFYRNRLVRAFLGASRVRTPDLFTGFDAADNRRISQLWPAREEGNWRPFQIINVALNVVSSERLSWQERKAEPFIVSPLYCGGDYAGYRDSAIYGDPKGITLGTAMAISGAAASPNMGYHSSPAITFLMTMFNVRLGWWLGNPGSAGEQTFRNEGPTFAIWPLVEEALGLTTDDRAYVYLSDGGHFENLGLYEMIRRRCRYIVVSDAGCDRDFTFEDLSNAVRKIEIDLGVTISFKKLEKLKPRPRDGTDIEPGQPYHAIGDIDYRAADGASENGTILYVKAGYHGVESAGIRGYALANPDFPHQPTIDQWFTESQFESYRALGFEITDGILSRVLADPVCATNPGFENLFATLRRGVGLPR